MKMKSSKTLKTAAALDLSHQLFSKCGFLKASSTSGILQPDSDAMMNHIIKCLMALLNQKGTNSTTQGSEKFKIFDMAVRMTLNQANSDLVNWLSKSPSSENSLWSPSEIRKHRRLGERMQSVYMDMDAAEYFWAPLNVSLISNYASNDLCKSARLLYLEYLEKKLDKVQNSELGSDADDSVADSEEENGMLSMETVLGSSRISDANKLQILSILRSQVPWLFFVKDSSNNYPLHYAVRNNCNADVLRLLVDTNPDAVNAQNDSSETPLHFLLGDGYQEISNQFDRFKVLQAAADDSIYLMQDYCGYTPLARACRNCALKTTSALLNACPTAATALDIYGCVPIHHFVLGISSFHASSHFAVFQDLLASNYEAASVMTNDKRYLLHMVARRGTLDMLKLTYEAYPEAVKYWSGGFGTPLHQAVLDNSVEKMEYLHSLYPEAARMVNDEKETLLHIAVSNSFDVVKRALSYFPEAIQMKSGARGFLPLHKLAERKMSSTETGRLCSILSGSTNSDALENLRLLLKHYPQAAKIYSDDDRRPYECLPKDNTELAQRLILRAAPAVNPFECHRLNYEARRGALYLLFAAELSESELIHTDMRHVGPLSTTSSATMTTAPPMTVAMTMMTMMTTMIMTVTGPRRSGSRGKVKTQESPPAAAAAAGVRSPQPTGPSHQPVPTSQLLIWRLLKGRADRMLLKEIVLFL
jgi:ankyrin repeat protein